MDGVIGRGTKVFEAAPVVVACVIDAGATFLAPIFDELTAVVCLSGTPVSHIGIVSREYRVPCIMGATLDAEPANGDRVEVDCTAADGLVRFAS